MKRDIHVPLGSMRKMNKLTLFLILFLLLTGCNTNHLDSKTYCDNERNLFDNNSTTPVRFPFGLTKEETLDNLQSQIELNLCNSMFVLNGEFLLSEKDTINILIITDIYCKDDSVRMNIIPNHPIRFTLIDIKDSNLYIDTKKVEIPASRIVIEEKIDSIVSLDIDEKIVFELNWYGKLEENFPKRIIKQIVDGYLVAVNKYSIDKYEMSLCSLQQEKINKIRRNNELYIKLSNDKPRPIPSTKPDFIEIYK